MVRVQSFRFRVPGRDKVFLSVVVVQRGMATSLTSYDFQKRRYRREKEMSVYIKDEEGVLHTPVQF
jgi:hypothetical protein